MKNFNVHHAGIRIKVRLLPTTADVHRAYRKGKRLRIGRTVHAFYEPKRSGAHYSGTMVLPLNGNLSEMVPHEVVHAVMWHLDDWVHCNDDEKLASMVGVLTRRILKKIDRHYKDFL